MSSPLKLVDPEDMPPSTLTADPYVAREFGNKAELYAEGLWSEFFNVDTRISTDKYSAVDFMGFGTKLYSPHFVQTKARSVWSTYFENYMLNLREYERLVSLQDITKYDVYLFIIFTDKAGYVKVPIRSPAPEEKGTEINKSTNSLYFPVSYLKWFPDSLFRQYFPKGWWKEFLPKEEPVIRVLYQPDASDTFYDWNKQLDNSRTISGPLLARSRLNNGEEHSQFPNPYPNGLVRFAERMGE